MDDTKAIIRAPCPGFACRECRTKTGWPHQAWCILFETIYPRCVDCRYHDPKKRTCVHPGRRKGDVFLHETAQRSL